MGNVYQRPSKIPLKTISDERLVKDKSRERVTNMWLTKD